jgi:TPR repeat protein
MLWTFILLIFSAHAAWPDSFEHRIAAMDALRYDLAMPGVPHDYAKVMSRYQVACDKGYLDVCHPEVWVSETGSDASKALDVFERKCSKNKKPLACVAVGIGYGMVDEAVSSSASNPTKAFQAFTVACEEKAYAPGCTYLGDMYREGVAVAKDMSKAQAYYEEACKAKDVWGCHRLADLQLAMDATQTDVGLKSYAQSCQSGFEIGCMAQASLMIPKAKSNSEWAFISKQMDIGCSYGQSDKCGALARLYHQGKGVQRSLPLAKALYMSSCSKGVSESCYQMGQLYLDMSPPMLSDAAKTFFDACEGGHPLSCTRYGHMAITGQGVERNVEFGLRFMNQGCNAGSQEGCLALVDAYATGQGVAKDLSKAEQLAVQTCDAGFGKGCYVLAQLSEQSSAWEQENSRDVTSLYEKACSLGYGHGCSEVALKEYSNGRADESVQSKLMVGCEGGDVRACLAMGQITAVDVERAQGFHLSACELDSMDGCLAVGKYFVTNKQIDQASTYFERVCSMGDERGCSALEPIAFEGKFSGIVRSAFLSNLCQVWARPDNADYSLLAGAKGATIDIHVGSHSGSTINIWHQSTNIQLDGIQRGDSQWNVAGKYPDATNVWGVDEPLDHTQVVEEKEEDVWGNEQMMDWNYTIQHVEEWDASKGSISRDFPGDLTKAIGDKAVIQYSRESERLFGQCGFVGGYTELYTEHCSDVQSLLLGYLLTDCSVSGKPMVDPSNVQESQKDDNNDDYFYY